MEVSSPLPTTRWRSRDTQSSSLSIILSRHRAGPVETAVFMSEVTILTGDQAYLLATPTCWASTHLEYHRWHPVSWVVSNQRFVNAWWGGLREGGELVPGLRDLVEESAFLKLLMTFDPRLLPQSPSRARRDGEEVEED
ncbi:calmodulin-binding transcription activator 1 isoform X1 [Lates japonicus]|uniref:Calmodulin-binding transcription activator 1 isoform X1 n=1 Tax=Lates japonicus TaxID=270547 RepID=A0AAD3NJI2_LATJO|nr:calmodulin-binding transcription activator 1 isoform X1 [Lates japonicus]